MTSQKLSSLQHWAQTIRRTILQHMINTLTQTLLPPFPSSMPEKYFIEQLPFHIVSSSHSALSMPNACLAYPYVA